MCILALVVQDRGRICQRSLEFTVAYTESVRVPRLQRRLLKVRTDALAHSAGWILVFKTSTNHSVVPSLSFSVHELLQAALAELVGRLWVTMGTVRRLFLVQLPLFFGASTNAQVPVARETVLPA